MWCTGSYQQVDHELTGERTPCPQCGRDVAVKFSQRWRAHYLARHKAAFVAGGDVTP